MQSQPRHQLRIRITAKSIAVSQSHLPKKLHGGLRCDHCEKLGLGAKPATPSLARIGSYAKSIAPCRMHLQKKLLKNLRGGLRCEKRGLHQKVC